MQKLRSDALVLFGATGDLRLGPGRVAIAIGASVKQRGVAMAGEPVELSADLGVDHDHDAYEWLLDAALDGDHGLNERAAGVMAAWQVVEPALNNAAPMRHYAPGTWGPADADRVLPRGACWHNPTPDP